MPKYIPSEEDLYSTRPCPICGGDIVDPKAEACSGFCEEEWELFKEDCAFMMMQALGR